MLGLKVVGQAGAKLQRGDTLAELARACGLDAERLQATVQRYNAMCAEGKDLDFAKGETPYNRANGDAGLRPNPCVAPIEHGPFYAVRVLPGTAVATPVGVNPFVATATQAQATQRQAHDEGAQHQFKGMGGAA